MEELLRRVHFVNVLPPTAGIGFEESREADIVEDFLPVQGKDQVAHRLLSGAFGMLIVRQDHGRRDRDPHRVRERVVEELVVGGPPERIVYDNRSMQHGVLQVGAVELNILRDTVDDDVVFFGLVHADAADLYELGRDAIDVHRVDLLHHCGWEGVFHTE